VSAGPRCLTPRLRRLEPPVPGLGERVGPEAAEQPPRDEILELGPGLQCCKGRLIVTVVHDHVGPRSNKSLFGEAAKARAHELFTLITDVAMFDP